jgi:hypothetical protein
MELLAKVNGKLYHCSLFELSVTFRPEGAAVLCRLVVDPENPKAADLPKESPLSPCTLGFMSQSSLNAQYLVYNRFPCIARATICAG